MKPHHEKMGELTANEVIQVLSRNNVAHLGCHDKDDIYVVPITYVFEDGYIYSHTKDGKKLNMMRNNSRVCIEVEEIENFFSWRSVIVQGKFEELSGPAADTAMRLLINKFAKKDNEYVTDLDDFSALIEMAKVYRIKINNATGRFEGQLK